MSARSMTAAEAAELAAAELAVELERKLKIAAREREVRVEVGERLRRVRAAAGLSLAQAADKAGGDFPAVVLGSYERGDRNISVARLVRLCGLYGVSPADVLPLTGAEQDPQVRLAMALHQAARHNAEQAEQILSRTGGAR